MKKCPHKTGGQRRLIELMDGLSQSGMTIYYVTSVFEVIAILRRLSKRAPIIAFDERYLLLAILIRLSKRPLIFCPRGNKLIHHSFRYSSMRLAFYKACFKFLYRYCDKMIFQTRAQMEEFDKLFRIKAKTYIVPNNINATWIKKIPTRSHFDHIPHLKKVGFLGGSEKRKGLDLLLEAFSLCGRKGLDIELLVGGKCDRGNIPSGVRVLGQIKEIEKFYQSVDLVVIPSIYDSFPNVLLEAVWARRVALISDSKISREICGNFNSIVFKRSPLALSKMLYDVYTSSGRWGELTIDCERLRNKYIFSWVDRMKKAIVE